MKKNQFLTTKIFKKISKWIILSIGAVISISVTK